MGNRNSNSVVSQVKTDYALSSLRETPTKVINKLPQRVSRSDFPSMCCIGTDIYICLSGQIYYFMGIDDNVSWGPATKLKLKRGQTGIYAQDLKCERGIALFRSGYRQMLIDGDTHEISPGTDFKINRKQETVMIDYELVCPYLDLFILNRIKSHTYSVIKAKVDSPGRDEVYYKIQLDEKIDLAQQFIGFDVGQGNHVIALTSKEAITLLQIDQLQKSQKVYHELIRLVDPIKAKIITISSSHYYILTACGSTVYIFNVKVNDGIITSEVETYEMTSTIYAMCLSEHDNPDLYILSKTCIYKLNFHRIRQNSDN
jgi:hypothetical protein